MSGGGGCWGGGGVSGEDERIREGKIVERVKERVRDREGQDVEGEGCGG